MLRCGRERQVWEVEEYSTLWQLVSLNGQVDIAGLTQPKYRNKGVKHQAQQAQEYLRYRVWTRQ